MIVETEVWHVLIYLAGAGSVLGILWGSISLDRNPTAGIIAYAVVTVFWFIFLQVVVFFAYRREREGRYKE